MKRITQILMVALCLVAGGSIGYAQHGPNGGDTTHIHPPFPPPPPDTGVRHGKDTLSKFHPIPDSLLHPHRDTIIVHHPDTIVRRPDTNIRRPIDTTNIRKRFDSLVKARPHVRDTLIVRPPPPPPPPDTANHRRTIRPGIDTTNIRGILDSLIKKLGGTSVIDSILNRLKDVGHQIGGGTGGGKDTNIIGGGTGDGKSGGPNPPPPPLGGLGGGPGTADSGKHVPATGGSNGGNLSVMPIVPNPLHGSAGQNGTVTINLQQDANVNAAIYDQNGSLITTLANTTLTAGQHSFVITGSLLRPGLYLVHVQADSEAQTTQLLVQ